jgi:murein DD-endopeptidase MepM/ murein hydrolase activator NlpD
VRNHGNRPHQDWYLEAPLGTPVYAIAPGEPSYSKGNDCGNCLQLEFSWEGETYYAFYAHLSHILMQSCSESEGAAIAFTGMSSKGASTLPIKETHLHLEIRTNKHVGKGLGGRIDPGKILGYKHYTCHQ